MPYRSSVTLVEPTVQPEEFRLKKTVFLGYADVAAGSIRALLGISMKKEYYVINIPALANNKIACVCPRALDFGERAFTPLQVWNLKYEQFSVILVNTVVRADKCHHVCSAIVDLCTESGIDKLVILSALRVDAVTSEKEPVFENTINDVPLTTYPPVPNEARMNDPFLSTLIQMGNVDFVPTCILSLPAHRACFGTAREEDGSQYVIETFQKVLNEVKGISFDAEFSFSLIYKGEDEDRGGPASMMYS